MMKTAVVYNADLDMAQKVADQLEKQQYQVKRIRELPKAEEDLCRDAIDLLVIQIDTSFAGEDGPIGNGRDYDQLSETVSSRIYQAITLVERCLPALERGSGKRIAFLTRSDSSIRECEKQDCYAEGMILSGMNMVAKMLFNRLRKQGFTLRCYAASKDAEKERGIEPGEYITMNFSYDENEPWIHSEENRFVMRDGMLREISW